MKTWNYHCRLCHVAVREGGAMPLLGNQFGALNRSVPMIKAASFQGLDTLGLINIHSNNRSFNFKELFVDFEIPPYFVPNHSRPNNPGHYFYYGNATDKIKLPIRTLSLVRAQNQ